MRCALTLDRKPSFVCRRQDEDLDQLSHHVVRIGELGKEMGQELHLQVGRCALVHKCWESEGEGMAGWPATWVCRLWPAACRGVLLRCSQVACVRAGHISGGCLSVVVD